MKPLPIIWSYIGNSYYDKKDGELWSL